MNLDALLTIVADTPVFSPAMLLSPTVSPEALERQFSRWTKAGKLHQLRRGLYTLAQPYQKVAPHPFLVANALKPASYVSLQSALAYYGLIPEYVPTVTSVCTGRPEQLQTPVGRFIYRHIKKSLFAGYTRVDLARNQFAFVATLEKCLLDLVYLTPGADARSYLEELRLQHLETLDIERLRTMANESGSPKLGRAADFIIEIAQSQEYQPL